MSGTPTNRTRALVAVVLDVWQGRIPAGHSLTTGEDGATLWLVERPMGTHTLVRFDDLAGSVAELVAAADERMAAALASHLSAGRSA